MTIPMASSPMSDASESDDDRRIRVPAGYATTLFDLAGPRRGRDRRRQRPRRARSPSATRRSASMSSLADINVEGAAETRETIAEQGGSGRSREARRDRARRMLRARRARCSATTGGVDILVNSAGSAFRCPAEDFPGGEVRLHPRSQSEGHVSLLPGVRRARCSRGARAASSTSPRSARSSPIRGRAPISPRRAACCRSRGRWRSNGATAACASTASARR